jgi:8-oxo-dGTP pyrophosphatase MutT (NUDIX family)
VIPKTSGELVASKTCIEGVASIPTSGESRLNVESMVSTLSLKGSKKNLRPVFYHQDNPKLEIKASGILPYTFNKKGKMFILFRLHKKKGKYVWEDCGGKSEQVDQSSSDCAIREASEETNGKLFDEKDSIVECQRKLRTIFETSDIPTIYFKRSKYLLHLVEVPSKLLSMPLKRFGSAEEGDLSIIHKFRWKNIGSIRRLPIHVRFTCNVLIKELKRIVK